MTYSFLAEMFIGASPNKPALKLLQSLKILINKIKKKTLINSEMLNFFIMFNPFDNTTN